GVAWSCSSCTSTEPHYSLGEKSCQTVVTPVCNCCTSMKHDLYSSCIGPSLSVTPTYNSYTSMKRLQQTWRLWQQTCRLLGNYTSLKYSPNSIRATCVTQIVKGTRRSTSLFRWGV